jgi:DNA-binding transcriptional ArsR family regulator
MTAEAALAALAEPRRRAILMLVRDEPHSVNEIAAHFDITQQAVSQHLQILKQVGLVAVQPAGQRRLYAVRTDGLESVRELLEQMWPRSLQHLKHAIEAGQQDGG